MLAFKALRLNGFKSFVDKTEVDIGPGLTGIIGPNGCGKSNILDALRWTMGEGSAKKMRGTGMEDVIFSGSASRSKRTSASVTITLDNSKRTAPAAYNGDDTIEVTRKIERDSGSLYKINGRTVRARDVQLLFSDTLSGTHSPSLVSQGRITSIISAKPSDRRQILEESAGISGLYARRHEAELRLRSADENLLRLEDVIENLRSRHASLLRQAREAKRYKDLGEQIRGLEKDILFVSWLIEQNKFSKAENAHEGAEKSVRSAMKVVSQLSQTEAVLADELPKLREKEAEAAASYQAYNLSIQRLEDEHDNIQNNIKETQTQLAQTKSDYEHTEQVLKESSDTLNRIEQEQSKLQSEQDSQSGTMSTLKHEKELAQKVYEKAEADYREQLRKNADNKASYESLKSGIVENERKLEQVSQKLHVLERELTQKRQENTLAKELSNKRSEIEALKNEQTRKKQEYESIKSHLEELEGALAASKTQWDNKKAKKDEALHELRALENICKLDKTESDAPVLNELKVKTGFEQALSIALGDSLNASISKSDASATWTKRERNSVTLPALPGNVRPLSEFVKAPDELSFALSMIGLVQDPDQGYELSKLLHPGQSLVDQSGNYWRWDGYSCKAGSQDQTSQFLEQKNRLARITEELPVLENQEAELKAEYESVLSDLNKHKSYLVECHKQLEDCTKSITDAQNLMNDLVMQDAGNQKNLAKLEEALEIAKTDYADIQNTLKVKQEKLACFENERGDTDHDKALEHLNEMLEQARQKQMETANAYGAAEQENTRREARLRAIADERLSIQNRRIRARKHLESLEERFHSLETKLKDLKNKPKELKDEKAKLLDSISELENRRNQASEALAKAENQAQEARQALKDAEESLSSARENRAHAQAAAQSAQENVSRIKEDIQARYNCAPTSLLDVKDQEALRDMGVDELIDRSKRQSTDLDNLLSRRNALGAVNLRASEEIEEIEAEMKDLDGEYEDLVKAIAELRQGISKLNKEARERLLKAFDTVNDHFQTLFVRLFNGGKAYLSLVDAEDPLESGLEIYAQPPGKSLQSLSLLSGGEQTLTSIALIFAMFLSNPSPICILDEVDAPLDDSNVDRVCNLLEDVASKGHTRFLVITHHRMTMARMDRLYGVTMAEKGVSKLVSVDMNEQMDLLESAAV